MIGFRNPRHLAAGLAMVLTAALTIAATPVAGPNVYSKGLDELIPRQLGPWTAVADPFVQMDLSPRRFQELQEVVYDQTLMRTYRRADGATVMLAVAYGRKQRQETKIHRPELCYVAQGFEVRDQRREVAKLARTTEVPVTRLVARADQRVEPVTYWIRLGDGFMRSAWDTRLTILRDGIAGRIPDGILVRVSSLVPAGSAPDSAYALQDAFLTDLLKGVEPEARRLLVGGVV